MSDVKIVHVGVIAPSTAAPDIVGIVAECPSCGSRIGPLKSPVTCSAVMVCPCGNRMEAWPS